MNKKFLFSAALLSTLALGGCVDNNESPSVTNIREAKAEQLKALAALDQANAQAALIIANAEKAAKEAQAAYNNAYAKYYEAQAALQEAQTEAEKQQLAHQLELNKIELEESRARLQATLADLEAQIARSKYEAENYKQQYDKLIAGVDAAKAREIQQLLTNYETASQTLIDAKRNLARETANLASLEAGLVGISENINKNIQDLEDRNVELQLDINAQNAIIATYEKYAGKTVTEEEVNAAHLKMVELEVAKDDAVETYQSDNNAKYLADKPLREYRDELWDNWLYGRKDLNYSVWNETTERFDNYYVTIQMAPSSAPAAARNKYCLVIDERRNNQVTYLPLFENYDQEQVTIDFELTNGAETYPYWVFTSNYDLIDNGKALETLISHKEAELNSYTNPEYLEYLKKQLPELLKAKEAAQTTFDAAVKKYDEAITANDAAQAAYEEAYKNEQAAWDAYYNNTDPDKEEALRKAAEELNAKTQEASNKYNDAYSAMLSAQNDKQNALNDLDYATENYNNCQASINNQESYAESLAEQLKEFKEDVAELIEMGKANVDNVKAYNEACAVEAKSYVAYKVAEDAYNVQNIEYYELYRALNWYGGLMGGNGDANYEVINAKNQIENLTNEMTSNTKKIDDYKQNLADLEAGKNTEAEVQKDLIADSKAAIEKYTVAIEVAQKRYDIAKAELEAAVKSEE